MSWPPRALDHHTLSTSIASGGMGSVHLAVPRNPRQPVVAVKRVHAHLARDPSFQQLLLEEAALAASIRHAHVVTTYGADMIGGEVVLVMEYAAGLTLRALAQHCGPATMPPRLAAAVIAGVLRGLHAAHEAVDAKGRWLRIVHRDVSPQNIILGLDGKARILDFGVAKAACREQATRVGELKGKLSYMAPEQLSGAPVDRRADVFATAIVLWEMLVGRPLFCGNGEGSIIAQVLACKVTSPRRCVAGVPRALDAIVMRGLSARREDRFGTALEMAAALDAVFAAEPVAPIELRAWMQSLAGAQKALHARAQMLSELRRRAVPPMALAASRPLPLRRAVPPPRPAPQLAMLAASLLRLVPLEVRERLPFFGAIFVTALACALLTTAALASAVSRDRAEPVVTEAAQ